MTDFFDYFKGRFVGFPYETTVGGHDGEKRSDRNTTI